MGFGQGWMQLGELGLALLLSAVIGLEREIRQKSAGLRTHTLVGFAAPPARPAASRSRS
jgi:putative Mg2+ transporter-C (MgtC) family protein